MESDCVAELERWLRDRFVELCKVIGQPVPFSGLRITPALRLEESRYFLLGLETGLFQTDKFGCVQSPLLAPVNAGTVKRDSYRIFQFDSLPPRLIRERICELATASLLILKRGWLTSHIQLEPGLTDNREQSFGIDLLIRSRTGQILAGVKVKRSLPELQKLIADLRACCARGPHARDDCGFPQNHPNYEFCAVYKPQYFWGVAPDGDVCVRMKCDNDSIRLEPLSSLPPRSIME